MVEWDGCFDGAWHIYGHIHGRRDEVYEFMKTRARSLNAGCMVNNFTPASFEELVENNKAFRGE
jgi:calcineurin-like phosphoesterase family protein